MAKTDPLGRNKQILALRKRIAKQLDQYAIFGNGKNPSVQAQVLAQYGEFRRVENEREIERIKDLLAGYMFNENVIIQGTSDDGTKVIVLSQFDAMMKASRLYLDTLNIQNKMWGLYAVSEKGGQDGKKRPLTAEEVSHAMVQELQKIARKEKPALPAHSEPRSADNCTPDPEL